ncbi:MAG: hypothetical protein WCK90_04660, partial [archaeon]
ENATIKPINSQRKAYMACMCSLRRAMVTIQGITLVSSSLIVYYINGMEKRKVNVTMSIPEYFDKTASPPNIQLTISSEMLA